MRLASDSAMSWSFVVITPHNESAISADIGRSTDANSGRLSAARLLQNVVDESAIALTDHGCRGKWSAPHFNSPLIRIALLGRRVAACNCRSWRPSQRALANSIGSAELRNGNRPVDFACRMQAASCASQPASCGSHSKAADLSRRIFWKVQSSSSVRRW